MKHPLWFCDGRLGFGFDDKGITRLEYFAPRPRDGSNIIFKRGVFDCFRCTLEKDGLRYAPAFSRPEIMPYGCTADCTVAGESVTLGVYAAGESLLFTVNGGDSFIVRLTFYESTQFIPAFNGDIDSRDFGMTRVWKPWEDRHGVLYGGFTEDDGTYQYTLNAAIVPGSICEYTRSDINGRICCALPPAGKRAVAVTFGTDDIAARVEAMRDWAGVLSAQQTRYRAAAERAPRLKSGLKAADKLFALAPLYYESLKAGGGVRAKSSRYWVWGWDGIIADDAPTLWGDGRFVREQLEFYYKTGDPEQGIMHACGYDNKPFSYSVLAAQGIYITMLERYWALTGDEEAARTYYPFAKTIFDRLMQSESRIPGLFEGTSLFPDFPVCLKETGRDISLFNNTVAYPAVRAMEKLALLNGDAAAGGRAKRAAEDMETHFSALYDEEKGFFVNSIDADTLEKRNSYNICGYFWDSEYHRELARDTAGACAAFALTHGLSPAGFRAIPVWDDAYDRDANQLHCTWAAVEEIVLRYAEYAGQPAVIRDWLARLGYWLDKRTVPEGMSYQYETAEPEFDAWNCEPGTWQAYTARKWYAETLSLVLGITADRGGLTFGRPLIPYRLAGLSAAGITADVTAEVQGEIAYIEINGEKFSRTRKLPLDKLAAARGKAKVRVVTGKPAGLYIMGAYGAVLTDYRENGVITAALSGYGMTGLFVHGAARVTLDGRPCAATYDKARRETFVRLYLEPGRKHALTVEEAT